MPECGRCSETHATVCEATWGGQSLRLCPGCWARVREWVAGEAGLGGETAKDQRDAASED